MRAKAVSLLVALVSGLSLAPLAAQEAEGAAKAAAEVEAPPIDDVKLIAQRAALSALSGKKPFILRESAWSGVIDPGKARLIQIQLFKRNDYQFWLAVPDRNAGVDVNVYDGKGQLVETENITYDVPNVASLIVTPRDTGVYYLRISLQTTITTPQKWSVIYAYR